MIERATARMIKLDHVTIPFSSDHCGAVSGLTDSVMVGLESSVASRWRGAQPYTLTSSLGVRVISGREDLETLFRLRYTRYVEEQGKRYPNAIDGKLEDRLDAVSINLGLFAKGRLVAAVRLTWLDDVTLDDYLAPIKSALPPELHSRTVVCSRLIADSRHGSVRTAMLLFLSAYRVGLESGGVHSVLSTAPDRCRSFVSIGYRETGSMFSSPIFGMQSVMVLDMLDEGIRRRFDRLVEADPQDDIARPHTHPPTGGSNEGIDGAHR